MKYILIVLVIIVVFSGCNIQNKDSGREAFIFNMINGQKLYDGKFPEMETFEDVADYVELVIDYDYNMDSQNPITDPKLAIQLGLGNCTTYTLVFMNVAHFTLDIDFTFAASDASNSTQKTIGVGGDPTHATVMLNDQLYSTYTGKKITDYEAGYFFDFNTVYP